jgi:hypothetical protein
VIFRWAAAIVDAWLAAGRAFRSWAGRPTNFRDWWRALPGDLLGLIVMRGLGIARHNRVYDAGDVRAWVVEDERVGRYFALHLIPTKAQTFGHYVFARTTLDPETMAHECEHIRQWQSLGPLYLPAYFGSSAAAFLLGGKPYWDNAFETAARRHAAEEASQMAATPAAAERDTRES